MKNGVYQHYKTQSVPLVTFKQQKTSVLNGKNKCTINLLFGEE